MAEKSSNPFQAFFAFAMGQTVNTGAGAKGTITGRMEGRGNGMEYRVLYYWNGTRQHEWFMEEELTSTDKVN